MFVLACAFLYSHLYADKGNQALLASLEQRWALVLGPLAVVVLLMVPVNWGLEALKWRMLVAPVATVSRARAFAATIAGTSVGLITPNRTGEFLGRVLFLPPQGRVAAGFATALGSIAQFVITLVAGGIGLVWLAVRPDLVPWSGNGYILALATLTATVAGGALVLYVFPGYLRQLILLVPFLHRLEKASAVLIGFSRSALLGILALSALRYLVFLLQFVLLLRVFQSGVPVAGALVGIPVIYLISTLVPTVMLTEVGVRGSAAVALLGPLGGSDGAVLLATFTLWLVNLVFPAVIGSVLILAARIGGPRS